MTVIQLRQYLQKKYDKLYIFFHEAKQDYWQRKIIHLDIIRIPKEYQRKNFGTRILTELTKYADENNFIITLTPDPQKGITYSGLIKFYKNLGFKKSKDPTLSGTFIRIPK